MNPRISSHIAESGLVPEDLKVREVSHAELSACRVDNLNVDGYVIPYFNINGKAIPFYRIRLFDYAQKYKQPHKTSSHIYFPPDFLKCVKESKLGCVVLTEGERKAVAGTNTGIPTVGLGGVDSWRSRTLVLPAETTLEQGRQGVHKVLLAKVPAQKPNIEIITDTVATGFDDLLDFLILHKLKLIIAYDTDLQNVPYVKTQVQRAANTLGHELVSRGMVTNCVRQMVLPPDSAMDKMGLDDYITRNGAEAFRDLVTANLSQRVTFPKHPSPKSMIQDRLNKGKVPRKEMLTLTRNLITEMDCRGMRMIDQHNRTPYYFDEETRTLMTAKIISRDVALHETPFGAHLYKKYGVSAADQSFMSRLAPIYTTADPLDTVSPVRVLTTTDNSVIMQISDGEMAIVSDDPHEPLKIEGNGYNGILFEQDHVQPINGKLLMEEFKKQLIQPLKPWWSDVLETVNLQGENDRELAALLFYISPWLRRWRGTQLPVEIVCGEAGSGKSSLFTLRLQILTGRPSLRNIPENIKDWQTSVGSTGGLHVIDNVQFSNKNLRQQISDEICRIITEPNPHVEMRTLYTTASLFYMPISTTFGFTAIDQPFHNADLLQRSAVFTVEAIKQGNLLGDWVTTHIEHRGGREAWLAHHLVVLHKFLALAEKEWDPHAGVDHRLAHYQQCLRLMGKLLGINTDWLTGKLTKATTDMISDSDWTLQGIKEFVDMAVSQGFPETSSKQIAEWCRDNDDYASNPLLTTPKRLGRYIASHKNLIRVTTGMTPAAHKRQNLIVYDLPKK